MCVVESLFSVLFSERPASTIVVVRRPMSNYYYYLIFYAAHLQRLESAMNFLAKPLQGKDLVRSYIIREARH